MAKNPDTFHSTSEYVFEYSYILKDKWHTGESRTSTGESSQVALNTILQGMNVQHYTGFTISIKEIVYHDGGKHITQRVEPYTGPQPVVGDVWPKLDIDGELHKL